MFLKHKKMGLILVQSKKCRRKQYLIYCNHLQYEKYINYLVFSDKLWRIYLVVFLKCNEQLGGIMVKIHPSII